MIFSPLLFGFADIEVARNIFLFGIRAIPLGIHMTLDVILGVFLIAAPWLFGYRGQIAPMQEYWHYVMGIGLFFAVGLAREKTETEKREHGVHVTAGI